MQDTQKVFFMSKFFTLLVISGFIALSLLAVFEFFPLFANYTAYNYQVALQLAREQAIETATIELSTQPNQHSNALSNLEVALPLFEQEQNILLQIKNTDDTVLVQESLPNYKAIDTAAKIILANPAHIDSTQVTIILQKGQGYRTAINELGNLIVLHSEEAILMQLILKIGLILALFGILIGKYLIYRERMSSVKQSE